MVYATKALADVAFNGISSTAKEDNSGRLVKRIYTSEDGKKHIAVRDETTKTENSLKSVSYKPRWSVCKEVGSGFAVATKTTLVTAVVGWSTYHPNVKTERARRP